MRMIYINNIKDIEINNELQNLISYTDDNMKEISLKGWSLLSNLIYEKFNIKLSKDIIKYNEYNKPYLENENIYFNISHSKDLIAIVISDKECGIDIEYIDYEKDLSKIIKKVLSKKERFIYKFKINKHKYFYKLWTIKEAYYKALGTGIKYNQLHENVSYNNIKSYIYKDNNKKYYVSVTK